jgi:hypothetical protein
MRNEACCPGFKVMLVAGVEPSMSELVRTALVGNASSVLESSRTPGQPYVVQVELLELVRAKPTAIVPAAPLVPRNEGFRSAATHSPEPAPVVVVVVPVVVVPVVVVPVVVVPVVVVPVVVVGEVTLMIVCGLVTVTVTAGRVTVLAEPPPVWSEAVDEPQAAITQQPVTTAEPRNNRGENILISFALVPRVPAYRSLGRYEIRPRK